MSPSRLLGLFLAPLLVALTQACESAPGTEGESAARPTSTASGASTSALSGTITIYAASSLTDVFNEMGKAFEAKNKGTKVQFNYGSSAALATQINEGAPADVFAPANNAQMRAVAEKGNVIQPAIFASNDLVVVVAKGNSQVQSFEDLARPGLKLVLAAQEVPVGQYAREALQKAAVSFGTAFPQRVLANVRSGEPNVRSVLTKVELGEADAGIVYSTDTATAENVRTVAIPAEFNVVAEYPIAALKGSRNRDAASGFVAFVLSPEGQAIVRKYGFGEAK